MTPTDGHAVSATLQALGRRFVPYINRGYRRTGTLWEGRFKASLVQEENYLLACYRYIEMNPVRALMVKDPADYPWSSHRANTLGERNPLLSPHPLYVALGSGAPERQHAYRNLFANDLEPETLRDLRSCLQTGTPLGNDRFRREIERSLGVKVGYNARGRPKKASTTPVPGAHQMDLDYS